MMDETEPSNYSIYLCPSCFERVPVCAIPTETKEEMLICLNCRSVLDSGQEPVYSCSEYKLYEFGWSEKKINKRVQYIRDVMQNEET